MFCRWSIAVSDPRKVNGNAIKKGLLNFSAGARLCSVDLLTMVIS
jgi:hypothetical protein